MNPQAGGQAAAVDPQVAPDAPAGALAEFRRGWPIVLTAAIGLACGLGALPIYSLGALTKPMADDLGWSRGEVQAIFTWMTVGNLVAAPALGWWLDRHGVRAVTLWSTLAMAIGFVTLGLATHSPYTAYLFAFLTAVFGVATTPISWTRAIVSWFDAGRGQALGFALAGTGVSAAVVPSYTVWLVERFGWRGAYVGLGALAVAIALPLGYWLLREPPGAPAARAARTRARTEAATVGVAAPDAGAAAAAAVPRALASWRFWVLCGTFVLVGGSIAGIIAHLVPMLSDRGMPAATAAQIAGGVGIAVILGRIVTGFLLDKFWAPGVACIVLGLPVASCLLLASGAGGLAGAVFAAMLVGLAAGAEFDLMSFLVSRYFGSGRYGVVYANLYAAFKIAAGVAAPFYGRAYDVAGNYTVVLYGAAGAIFVGAGLLLSLGAYPRLEAER
ncbi:MAG: MFS transporter [Steroidobacteraceae bacterium]|nr:MFS transporter [Steroidobacteraceae bacterium]